MGEYMVKQDKELLEMIKAFVNDKALQRQTEEKMEQIFENPTYKKWMQERIADQYKHERFFKDIGLEYFKQEIEVELSRNGRKIQSSLSKELVVKLEETVRNIQSLNQVMLYIEDFKVYKLLQSMISDECIYLARLTLILRR